MNSATSSVDLDSSLQLFDEDACQLPAIAMMNQPKAKPDQEKQHCCEACPSVSIHLHLPMINVLLPPEESSQSSSKLVGRAGCSTTTNEQSCLENQETEVQDTSVPTKPGETNTYCDRRSRIIETEENDGSIQDAPRKRAANKRHTCDICSATFQRLYDVKRHKRCHEGDKPYKCDVCQAMFSNVYNKNRHMTIHTGEKPYKCDVCGACFSRKEGLWSHVKLHTSGNKCKNDDCRVRLTVTVEVTNEVSK